MPETHFIYILKDPRNGVPRYVGKTKHPKERLRNHIGRPSSGAVKRWIVQLSRDGVLPEIEIIDKCCGDEWVELEAFYVIEYRAKYPDQMLNVLSGGKGPLDSDYTDEIRSAHKARMTSPEFRAAASSKTKAWFSSAERRAEHAARLRIINGSPEARARNSEIMKVVKNRPESRAAHSALMKIVQNTPERRELARAKAEKQWADPAARAAQGDRKRAEAARKKSENPQAWAVFQATRGIKIREGIAKAKAARLADLVKGR